VEERCVPVFLLSKNSPDREQPATRSPSIQKLGVITVAKLEAAAMDSLAVWFADPNKPENAQKKPILKELFRVAKMEEEYKQNNIGGFLLPNSRKRHVVLTPCPRRHHPGHRHGRRHGHGPLLRPGRRRGRRGGIRRRGSRARPHRLGHLARLPGPDNLPHRQRRPRPGRAVSSRPLPSRPADR
jgi:hypothetical protein